MIHWIKNLFGHWELNTYFLKYKLREGLPTNNLFRYEIRRNTWTGDERAFEIDVNTLNKRRVNLNFVKEFIKEVV